MKKVELLKVSYNGEDVCFRTYAQLAFFLQMKGYPSTKKNDCVEIYKIKMTEEEIEKLNKYNV